MMTKMEGENRGLVFRGVMDCLGGTCSSLYCVEERGLVSVSLSADCIFFGRMDCFYLFRSSCNNSYCFNTYLFDSICHS